MKIEFHRFPILLQHHLIPGVFLKCKDGEGGSLEAVGSAPKNWTHDNLRKALHKCYQDVEIVHRHLA